MLTPLVSASKLSMAINAALDCDVAESETVNEFYLFLIGGGVALKGGDLLLV